MEDGGDDRVSRVTDIVLITQRLVYNHIMSLA